jgi:hypothetical protein
MPFPRVDGVFPPVSHDEVLSRGLAVARWSPVPALSLNCMWIEARAEPPDPGSGRS